MKVKNHFRSHKTLKDKNPSLIKEKKDLLGTFRVSHSKDLLSFYVAIFWGNFRPFATDWCSTFKCCYCNRLITTCTWHGTVDMKEYKDLHTQLKYNLNTQAVSIVQIIKRKHFWFDTVVVGGFLYKLELLSQ